MPISAALGSSALLPAGLGFRNIVINGGFDVWQRGTSLAVGTTQSTSYIADRWSAYRTGGGFTQSRQSAALDGFQYCYRLQRDNGNSGLPRVYTGTSFETSACVKLQNLPVTLSFYARKGSNFSATSDAFRAVLYSGTGSEANGIYTGFTNINTIINQTATLTTSWQRFVYAGIMPATVTQLFIEFSYVPVGTAGAADYVDITGVQLEQNTQPTPFEQRPYGIELELCKRYYQQERWALEAGPLVSNLGFLWSNNAYKWVNVTFGTEMRAAPTITTESGAGAGFDGKARYLTSNGSGGGVDLTPYGFTIKATSFTLKSYNEANAYAHYGLNAGYRADAELP